MKIGILGAGNVGATLARRWLEAGHDVALGARDPGLSSVAKAFVGGDNDDRLVSIDDAVRHGDAIVTAVPYAVLESVVRGIGDFGNKVIIDCTNPIAPDFSGIISGISSAAEQIVEWSGSTRVVKAFNTIGYNIMADPDFDGRKATLLHCGDDVSAKQTVAGLARDIGFDPLDAGPLSMAGVLEQAAWLWIHLAVVQGTGRNIAFVLHKR